MPHPLDIIYSGEFQYWPKEKSAFIESAVSEYAAMVYDKSSIDFMWAVIRYGY